MSDLRKFALTLIDDNDILCIEAEEILDKADSIILSLERERDEARQIVMEQANAEQAVRFAKKFGYECHSTVLSEKESDEKDSG